MQLRIAQFHTSLITSASSIGKKIKSIEKLIVSLPKTFIIKTFGNQMVLHILSSRVPIHFLYRERDKTFKAYVTLSSEVNNQCFMLLLKPSVSAVSQFLLNCKQIHVKNYMTMIFCFFDVLVNFCENKMSTYGWNNVPLSFSVTNMFI